MGIQDDIDERRELAMRPYVANDLTNLRYKLHTPAYEQVYEKVIHLAYKRLIVNRPKESIPLILLQEPIKGPNIQKAIFNNYEPARIELNPEDNKATKVAANFVNRNAGTFLKKKTGHKDSIQNAFESYERKWHVSSNFIHMCGFYFDGGPAEARENEKI